jgi:hypothetical protein
MGGVPGIVAADVRTLAAGGSEDGGVVRVTGDFNLSVLREPGTPRGFSDSSITPTPDSTESTQ